MAEDIKLYIESGILEQYVLGTLTPNEKAEVEKVIKEYPEVAKEIQSIEKGLEVVAFKAAKTPQLSENQLINNLKTQSTRFESKEDKRSNNGWRNLLALVSLGLLAGLFYFNSVNNHLKSEHNQMRLRLDSIQKACAVVDSQYRIILSQYQLLQRPDVKLLRLNGTALAPNAYASVIIDTSGQKLYFDLAGLPSAPAGKQFQLWLIKGGVPVDMGIVDDLMVDTLHILEKPFTAGVQAFALTLEDDGGKPSPTLDQMYVIGELK